jgi:hypothetical protein
MVRYDVVVISKFFVANGTFFVLFDDLPIQELPHHGW